MTTSSAGRADKVQVHCERIAVWSSVTYTYTVVGRWVVRSIKGIDFCVLKWLSMARGFSCKAPPEIVVRTSEVVIHLFMDCASPRGYAADGVTYRCDDTMEPTCQ